MTWVVPFRSPELTTLFNGFTWLGYTPFFLLFLPIGYWLWDKHMFTRLAVLIIIFFVTRNLLKRKSEPPAEEAGLEPRN